MHDLAPGRIATLILYLLALALCLGCQATGSSSASAQGTRDKLADSSRWRDQEVFARVGMKFELKGANWHMYSTNHIGLPKHVSAGTKLTVRRVQGTRIELTGDDRTNFVIDFVAKHNQCSQNEWMLRQFSLAPVELRPELTDAERAAIRDGTHHLGMSREALFLSLGYPPASLTPSLEVRDVTYDVKRFNRIVFTFDEQDHLLSVRD